MDKVSGYVYKFNEPTKDGLIYKKESFDMSKFEQLKMRGEILDFEIDEFGVKIIKQVDITSFDVCNDILNATININFVSSRGYGKI